MTLFLKKLAERFTRKPRPVYELVDIFGCTEKVPQDCPTFLERQTHLNFKNALKSYNIIVVYGESRQGKTWMVDKYCSNQIRVGCNASMSFSSIKEQMLNSVGVKIRSINHSITENTTNEASVQTSIGKDMIASAGTSAKQTNGFSETISTTYETVDINNMNEYLTTIREKSAGKYFVFDNFHYLLPKVQKEFCTLLKEFNYQNIKVIIVGVWKDASRITALAPDLVNRCSHIDIGSWNEDELIDVLGKGEKALNVSFDDASKRLFIDCCAKNIGIFKDMIQKCCQLHRVYETVPRHMHLGDEQKTNYAISQIMDEAYTPLHDRIVNLAMPQRAKKDSKHMRLKIIIAVLELVAADNDLLYEKGIPFVDICEKINELCETLGESKIQISNLTQELGALHLREENRQTGTNFIPLFFYDQPNKHLLILEPTLYAINNYSVNKIIDIANELKMKLPSANKQLSMTL